MLSELKVADEALDRVQQPTSFLVQSQREKASEAARLRETVKIQNKKIIDQEETIDRLRQVCLISNNIQMRFYMRTNNVYLDGC